MIEFLIAGMLAWMSVNCAVVDEIHPEHNPCQYNYDVTHPKVAFLSQKDLKSKEKVYLKLPSSSKVL